MKSALVEEVAISFFKQNFLRQSEIKSLAYYIIYWLIISYTHSKIIYFRKTHKMISERPYDIIHTSYQYLQLVHDYEYLSVLH